MSASRRAVLVAWPFASEQLTEMRTAASPMSLRYHPCDSAAAVYEALDETVEVLFTFFMPQDVSAAPDIRWVQLYSAGIDQLREHPILERDVLVTTTSGIHATPVGEYVLGLMLALARHLPLIERNRLHRVWPVDRWTRMMGREIRGSTVGIVGYGSIGREVARLVRALGARVLAAKRHPESRSDQGYSLHGVGDPEGLIPERFFGPNELLPMLAQCDYVVLTVPTTAETLRLIGERELRAMKRDAFLINVARGGIIEQETLTRALREGWIGGAALDVFEDEPLPADDHLWNLENVIVSPHVAGASVAYNSRAAELFADNLERYLQGRDLLNLVDRHQGY